MINNALKWGFNFVKHFKRIIILYISNLRMHCWVIRAKKFIYKNIQSMLVKKSQNWIKNKGLFIVQT